MTRPEFFSQGKSSQFFQLCYYITQLCGSFKGPGLMFREANYPLAYGLTITNAATSPMMRALMMAIQGRKLN